jgi:hypothetical protein
LPLALKNESVTYLNKVYYHKYHLLSLTAQLTKYFSDTSNILFPLVKTPIAFQAEEMPDTAEDDLIETISDTVVLYAFSVLLVSHLELQREYDMGILFLNVRTTFVTLGTHLCAWQKHIKEPSPTNLVCEGTEQFDFSTLLHLCVFTGYMHLLFW